MFICTFKKKLHRLNQHRLFCHIKQLVVDGKVHKYISIWYNNRQQRIVINGAASEWMPFTSGAPLGSVHGPVLFVIYISDIDGGLTFFVTEYTDDAKVGNSVLLVTKTGSLQGFDVGQQNLINVCFSH